MDTNYSLADIKAVTEPDGDEFGGGWIWVLLLFLFMSGGWGGARGGEALTRAEMQSGFDNQTVLNKLNGLENGLCDGFYAQNTTMLNGFAGVNANIADARFAMEKCCCETNRNIDGVKYELSTAIHAEGEATRAMIQANEIQNLRDKVADLQLAQSQCAQNEYLVNRLRPCAVPAYLTCSPYTSFNGCGCNNI